MANENITFDKLSQAVGYLTKQVERITRKNLNIIRKLIGESTNLNQLAKQANKQGFFRVRDECRATALKISQLIKRIKDDR